MNEKITLQELITLLTEKQGMNRKDAELFVKSFFGLIEEALGREKYVKVKGLGIFKLTEVESRESVNVNTGERIEIQGHTKVSFTPDSTMKDLINKPFAHFESVVLNDGVELEDTPVEQVADELPIIEEAQQPEVQPEPVIETPVPMEEPVVEEPMTEPKEEPITEEPVEEKPTEETITEEVITIEEPAIEEPAEEVVEEVVEEPVEESPMEAPQPETTGPKEEPEEKPVSIEEKASDEKIIIEVQKEKNINRILWGVIVVLVLIILFGAYWMFLRPADVPEPTPAPPVQEEVATPVPVTEKQPQEDVLKTIQFIELSEEELRKERVPSFADTLDCQIVGTQEEYTLQKGETIIRASVRFFGTKKYWPYIVKHNMDVLPDPDNIPAGIRIKIPKLVEK